MHKTRASDSTDDDLSGFVEHLRFVHFTLVGACLAAIIAVTSQGPSSASRAYDEVSQLLILKEKWANGWLDDLLPRLKIEIIKANAVPEKLMAAYSGAIGETTRRFYFDASDKWLLTTGNGLADTGIETDPRSTLLPRKFDRLEDMKKIWNLLAEHRYLIFARAADGGLHINNDSQISILELELSRSSDETEIRRPRFFLRADLLEYLQGEARSRAPSRSRIFEAAFKAISDRARTCYLYKWEPQGIFIFYADCLSRQIALQSLLTDGLEPRPPPGTFSRSFPDLDDLAKNLNVLSIDNLQTVFLAERNRSGEKVEFFGAKLPGESVANWGTFILLTIAGYLCIQFRDFTRRTSPTNKAWNVPWLGTSSYVGARIAFLITAVSLPIIVGYLAGHRIQASATPYSWLVFSLALLVAVGCAAAMVSSHLAAVDIRKSSR